MRWGYTPPIHCLILTVRFNPGTLEPLGLPLNWQIIYITPVHPVKGSPEFQILGHYYHTFVIFPFVIAS